MKVRTNEIIYYGKEFLVVFLHSLQQKYSFFSYMGNWFFVVDCIAKCTTECAGTKNNSLEKLRLGNVVSPPTK